VEFEVPGPPLLRLYCHCTVCQKFNDAPYSDILVYRADDVGIPQAASVQFRALRSPPNIQRGKCVKCYGPVVEKFNIPFSLGFTIVPVSAHSGIELLPESVAHLFYDKRVNEHDDSLPKYHGYVSSQLAFAKLLFKANRALC